jgi:hypothetical protein
MAGFRQVNASLLYSFVHAPGHINTEFLGLIDITKKSATLAVLAAAITSYFQIKIATGRQILRLRAPASLTTSREACRLR